MIFHERSHARLRFRPNPPPASNALYELPVVDRVPAEGAFGHARCSEKFFDMTEQVLMCHSTNIAGSVPHATKNCGSRPVMRDASRLAIPAVVDDIEIDYERLHLFVERVLKEGSFSARKLSLLASDNKNPDLVRNMQAGTKPALKSVIGLARALDVPATMFFRNWAPPGMTPKAWLLVSGPVEAGIWREQVESPPDEWFEVEVDAPEAEIGPHEHGLVVRGRSMDKIFPPGTILRCVDLITSHAAWGDGDYVIVERHRGDFVELTCKRLARRIDGAWELRPESHSEEFRDPIYIGRPSEGNDLPGGGITDGEVRVRALVIDAFLPLARRRTRPYHR